MYKNCKLIPVVKAELLIDIYSKNLRLALREKDLKFHGSVKECILSNLATFVPHDRMIS